MFKLIDVSPLVFIVANDHALAAGGAARKQDLTDLPMILSERGLARERVDRWFRAIDARPNIYAQVAGNEAIVSMVSLGFGVGVVPKIVLDNSPLSKQVRTLDVEPALAPYEVGLVTTEKKRTSPLIGAFWDALA